MTPDHPLARRSAIVAFVVGGVILAFLLFEHAAHVFLVAFAGLLLAVYLRGLAALLQRFTRIPRAVGVGIVLFLHLGAAVLFAWYGWSSLSVQLDAVYDALPRALDRIRADLGGAGPLGAYLADRIPTSLDDLPTGEGRPLSQVRVALASGMSVMVDLAVMVIVGVYGALDPGLYRRGVLALIPQRRRARVEEVLDELTTTLRWWWVGRMTAAAIVGVLCGIGLAIMGVPLAALMGLLAALLTFIPNIGPLIALVPPAMLAMLESQSLMWGVIALYSGVQFLESYFITPLIQKRAVHVPPAMLIIFQVLGGVLAGPIGLAMADPIAAVSIVVVGRFYVEDVLGGDAEALPPDDDDDSEEHSEEDDD